MACECTNNLQLSHTTICSNSGSNRLLCVLWLFFQNHSATGYLTNGECTYAPNSYICSINEWTWCIPYFHRQGICWIQTTIERHSIISVSWRWYWSLPSSICSMHIFVHITHGALKLNWMNLYFIDGKTKFLALLLAPRTCAEPRLYFSAFPTKWWCIPFILMWSTCIVSELWHGHQTPNPIIDFKPKFDSSWAGHSFIVWYTFLHIRNNNKRSLTNIRLCFLYKMSEKLLTLLFRQLGLSLDPVRYRHRHWSRRIFEGIGKTRRTWIWEFHRKYAYKYFVSDVDRVEWDRLLLNCIQQIDLPTPRSTRVRK